jgi:hypothetical protein
MTDGRSLMLRGLARREGDYWASIVIDFNVVGTGDSPEDAIMRSIRMTVDYLEEGCAAGKKIRELKRRAPLRVRLDYRYLHSLLTPIRFRYMVSQE